MTRLAEINEVEDIWAKDAISKDVVAKARLIEIEKLVNDFWVFKVMPRSTWAHETLNYTWVDTVKQAEARARFTVADWWRNQPGNAETFSLTPHIATIRMVELKAIDRE